MHLHRLAGRWPPPSAPSRPAAGSTAASSPGTRPPAARPQLGRFRAQCEYVVWGTAGPRSTPPGAECLPGLYRGPSPRDRVHLAQKPVDLLALLCRIAPAGGTALDPFAGSATTALACLSTRRHFIGCEIDPVHFATAEKRIREVVAEYGA